MSPVTRHVPYPLAGREKAMARGRPPAIALYSTIIHHY